MPLQELTVEQVKEKMYSSDKLMDSVDKTLIQLLREGKIRAFLKPDGEILYKLNTVRKEGPLDAFR